MACTVFNRVLYKPHIRVCHTLCGFCSRDILLYWLFHCLTLRKSTMEISLQKWSYFTVNEDLQMCAHSSTYVTFTRYIKYEKTLVYPLVYGYCCPLGAVCLTVSYTRLLSVSGVHPRAVMSSDTQREHYTHFHCAPMIHSCLLNSSSSPHWVFSSCRCQKVVQMSGK